MRYRKRITLAKGVRLNISKSGFSTTLGMRGLSMNVGKNGAFLNTGITGTGLYNRHNISKGSSNSSGKNKQGVQTTGAAYRFDIDDTGIVTIKDEHGYTITDESLLRKIKRAPEYRDILPLLMEQYKEYIEKDTQELIEIYKYSSISGTSVVR